MMSFGNECRLIDTNIYSYAMRGDAEIIKSLQQVAHIGISAISIGELLSGFKAGNKEKIPVVHFDI